MRLKDTFGFAVNNLVDRGMRSWLTVLGVVVGITAVVAIVSIGAGLQASISEQISAWGTNTITVSPGYSRASTRSGFGSHRTSSSLSSTGGNLTSNDEKMLETIPEVLYVNGVISGRGEVSFMNEASQVSIQGVRPEVWSEMVSARIAEGRYLTQSDSFSAVVGDRIAKGLFTQSLNVNGRITIEGRSYKIVGVLEPSVMGSEDNYIFIPRSTAADVIEDAEDDQFTSIVVEVDERDYRVLTLLSDGECQEGTVWEAALFASHHKLDNLIAIIDHNKLQSLGQIEEILSLKPFEDKWESFGWEVREVDGHDISQLSDVLASIPFSQGKPSVLIAHTTKGKGVSFMESVPIWHNRLPGTTEEWEIVCRELELDKNELGKVSK